MAVMELLMRPMSRFPFLEELDESATPMEPAAFTVVRLVPAAEQSAGLAMSADKQVVRKTWQKV